MQVEASPSPNSRPAEIGVEALWLEFRDRLRAFVSRRVSNPPDVDDLVQWVFLQMHRNLGAIRRGERVHAWLYSTARRAIADHYRSGSRRREVPSGNALDIDALQPRPPDVGGDDRPNERQEVAACLAPLVERLVSTDRDAIALTEIQGLHLRDAAARAGLSLSGMKSRVQRARRRLKKAMLDCCHLALDGRGAPIGCAKRAPVGDPCGPKPDLEKE
jgi:RNA polymerase sigma-70 factor (ECF subfamily)